MLNLNINYPENSEFWHEWFASTITNSNSWSKSAKDLIRVLDILSPQIDLTWAKVGKSGSEGIGEGIHIHGVYLMLSAYAVENYLKGALVIKEKWSTADIQEELPKELKSHNLKTMANSLNLTINEEEQDLLERLSEYAIWAGRYPVPLYSKDLKPKIKGQNLGNQLTSYRGSDTAVIACFLKKLDTLLTTGQYVSQNRIYRDFDGHIAQMHVRAS